MTKRYGASDLWALCERELFDATKGAFTLDTSDPHHIDPHQFDPHQRVHTRQKDNPHQIDLHQLDPHQVCVPTRRKNVMRINLIFNRFANWKNARHT